MGLATIGKPPMSGNTPGSVSAAPEPPPYGVAGPSGGAAKLGVEGVETGTEVNPRELGEFAPGLIEPVLFEPGLIAAGLVAFGLPATGLPATGLPATGLPATGLVGVGGV
jgi:hypothetical protein